MSLFNITTATERRERRQAQPNINHLLLLLLAISVYWCYCSCAVGTAKPVCSLTMLNHLVVTNILIFAARSHNGVYANSHKLRRYGLTSDIKHSAFRCTGITCD